MGKIDEAQDPVNHRVAQRNEGINGTKGKTVDNLLQKFSHERTDLYTPRPPGVDSWMKAGRFIVRQRADGSRVTFYVLLRVLNAVNSFT